MHYLVYVVFGEKADPFRAELVYSLLSLNKVADEKSKRELQVLIYTDTQFPLPAALQHLRVDFRLLEKETVAAWIQRGNGHVLILKARVMLEFLQEYQSPGVLVDTDTFFLKDPLPLFKKVEPGISLMHLKEYHISRRPGIADLFQQKTFTHSDGTDFKILPDFHMWNSGVIGVHHQHTLLLPDIISLIEQISFDKAWPAGERRFIEQTAYSYYLQKQERLLPAEEYVVHYWFFKEARFLLASYFDFFYKSDRQEFLQMLAIQSMRADSFAKLPYNMLTPLIIKLMKKYGLVEGYVFECLPPDTHIGQLLRTEYYETAKGL